MADNLRNEGRQPDTRSTTSSSGIDPATHTIETTPGMHTGRESSSGTGSMGDQTGMGSMSDHNSTADRVQDTANDLATKAREKASQLAGKARQQASSQISGQKQRVTESLSGISGALHETSQSLRGSNQDMMAGFIDDAAGYVDQVSDYLSRHSVADLLDEAQHFARREPALFVGGAFVLGLLGARFMKSSSPSASYYGGDQYGVRRAGMREQRFGSYVPGGVAGDHTRTHAYEQPRTGTAADEALGVRSSSNTPTEREDF